MKNYAKQLERIENLMQVERDKVKRWHYKRILKETITKIEAMNGGR